MKISTLFYFPCYLFFGNLYFEQLNKWNFLFNINLGSTKFTCKERSTNVTRVWQLLEKFPIWHHGVALDCSNIYNQKSK